MADAHYTWPVTFPTEQFVEELDRKLACRCCYTAAEAEEGGNRFGQTEKAGMVEEEMFAVAEERTRAMLVEVDNFGLFIRLTTFDRDITHDNRNTWRRIVLSAGRSYDTWAQL